MPGRSPVRSQVTVSVCLGPAEILAIEQCRRKATAQEGYVSRSALVRRLLRLGVEVFRKKEEIPGITVSDDDDPHS